MNPSACRICREVFCSCRPPAQVAPGERVTWLYRAPRGWNGGEAVPAVVEAIRPRGEVVIRVERRDGTVVRRRVGLASLRLPLGSVR